jgi:hypothetical protein
VQPHEFPVSPPNAPDVERWLLAAEADANEVGSALHDGPAQALIALRYVLELTGRGRTPAADHPALAALSPEDRAEALAALVAPLHEHALEALAATRRIMGASRSRPDPTDLAATLASLRDAWGLPDPGPVALPRVRPAVGVAAYRLLQSLVPDPAVPVDLTVELTGEPEADGVRITLGGAGHDPACDAARRWRERATAVGIMVNDGANPVEPPERLMTTLIVPTQMPGTDGAPRAPHSAACPEELS